MNIEEIKKQYLSHGGTETLRGIIINSGGKPETTDKMLGALADWWISKFIEREEELRVAINKKKNKLCNSYCDGKCCEQKNQAYEECLSLLSLTRKDI